MLTAGGPWTRVVEVNPPELPDMRHRELAGRWDHVLVTDNVFGRIRVSPYAYAARLTHDVPETHPTVVVSTRDRNILAIESEVRGALGNGVDSFLVVIGDTMPHVDHLAHHHEIVEHLVELQADLPDFEVGMPTRFREWQFRQRIDKGAQFFVAGPVLDPETVGRSVDRLRLRAGDPPVFLMLVPPFSPTWVDRMEDMGVVPAGELLRKRLAAAANSERRAVAWQACREAEQRARDAGCAGVILMGLKFSSVLGEAAEEWGGGPR